MNDREAFEKWYWDKWEGCPVFVANTKERTFRKYKDSLKYFNNQVQRSCEGWQAAIASQQGEAVGFEAFMFSERGCELHSMINTSDISANAFAREVWQACEAHKQAEINTLNAAITEDKILSEINAKLQTEIEEIKQRIKTIEYWLECKR
jgi:hypothetical protein